MRRQECWVGGRSVRYTESPLGSRLRAVRQRSPVGWSVVGWLLYRLLGWAPCLGRGYRPVMHPTLSAYHGLLRMARRLTPLIGRTSGKVGRGFAGRRDSHEILAAWGRSARDHARPLAWFHAPSVGEGLQARAVLDGWVGLRPELQTVFTHFSPSAETLAGQMGADTHAYLPWDLPDTVSTALHGVAPDVLVFTKTEIWPTLTAEAVSRGVRIAMVGATLPADAGRSHPLARRLLRTAWGSVDLLAAIDDDHAARFVTLGVPPRAVHATGDPGIDSALSRAERIDAASPWIAPFLDDPRPTVVAGSTWPADEAELLPALDQMRAAVPSVRLILAAHEPDERHTRDVTERLTAGGWNVRTLGQTESDGAAGVDAVIVDRVGVLAELYSVASASFVGGGFHDKGLHSVLEPAAAGSPVCFGPRHTNSAAASGLLHAGGAEEAPDAQGLARILMRWLTDSPRRDFVAARAAGYIDTHLGAAHRTARLLDTLLTSGPPSPRT